MYQVWKSWGDFSLKWPGLTTLMTFILGYCFAHALLSWSVAKHSGHQLAQNFTTVGLFGSITWWPILPNLGLIWLKPCKVANVSVGNTSALLAARAEPAFSLAFIFWQPSNSRLINRVAVKFLALWGKLTMVHFSSICKASKIAVSWHSNKFLITNIKWAFIWL